MRARERSAQDGCPSTGSPGIRRAAHLLASRAASDPQDSGGNGPELWEVSFPLFPPCLPPLLPFHSPHPLLPPESTGGQDIKAREETGGRSLCKTSPELVVPSEASVTNRRRTRPEREPSSKLNGSTRGRGARDRPCCLFQLAGSLHFQAQLGPPRTGLTPRCPVMIREGEARGPGGQECSVRHVLGASNRDKATFLSKSPQPLAQPGLAQPRENLWDIRCFARLDMPWR